jgi:hypothetical protein
MSEPDHIIGTALRELSSEATPPRLNAGALWRAGRRRRRAAITASVAGAAAAAGLLPLAIFGALANPAPAPGPASAHRLPPIHFPIQVRQVARIADSRCPPRSPGLPGLSKDECFYFTRAGMTISSFASVKISGQAVTCFRGSRRVLHATGPAPGPAQGPGTIELSFRLQPADIHPYAGLTQKLANQPSPRNQLAIIANGVVMFHPRIVSDVSYANPPYLMMTASTLHSRQRPGGWTFWLAWLTRAQAGEFLGHLPAPACLAPARSHPIGTGSARP